MCGTSSGSERLTLAIGLEREATGLLFTWPSTTRPSPCGATFAVRMLLCMASEYPEVPSPAPPLCQMVACAWTCRALARPLPVGSITA